MTDIFSDPSKSPDPAPTPIAVKVDDLVGEGKKFATLEDLARSKVEADNFIQHLTQELKGLRESVQRDTNAVDNLAKMQAEIADLKAKLISKSAEPSPDTTGALTTDKLEALVASVMTKKEQERTANQNISAANADMVKVAGSLEKAAELMRSKASELHMSVDELKAIASKSPTAFGQLMGLNGAKPAVALDSITQRVNPAALSANNGQPKKGTAAYYNNLRKEIGNQAFFANTKLQREIFEAKKSGLYDQQ